MTIDISLLFCSISVILIELYSETQIKNNGSLLERLVHLINIKSLFNIVKLATLLSAVLIIFPTTPFLEIAEGLQKSPGIFPLKTLVYPFVLAIVIILYNHTSIAKQFGNFYLSINYPRLSALFSNLQYLLFRLLSFGLIFYILSKIYNGLLELHNYLTKQDLEIFDWIFADGNQGDNYNKGVYFSLVLTTILFFIFNNAFLKRQSTYFDYRKIRKKFFLYFFISIILSIGLFFGFFSIFNGIYNLLNTGFTEWITKENLLGILPIRISAVLILFYLITYVYRRVLNSNLTAFLVVGILPLRRDSSVHHNIFSLNNRETLFFCQISFYVINLALAEMFLIYEYENVYLSLLNFSILFIVDDFKIIDDYNRYFGKVLNSHFIRITIFNIIMIVSSITILVIFQFYFYLLLYFVLVSVLTRFYIMNLHHYR